MQTNILVFMAFLLLAARSRCEEQRPGRELSFLLV
jgi:hypothetical protein